MIDAGRSRDRFPVDMFDDCGFWNNGLGVAGMSKPATGTRRSPEADNVMPVQLLRSPITEELTETGSAESPTGETFGPTDAARQWLRASTAQGFTAWLNKCTHFCCVPGFKQQFGAAKSGAQNKMYRPCHQSVYEPFSVVPILFTARPRPF